MSSMDGGTIPEMVLAVAMESRVQKFALSYQSKKLGVMTGHLKLENN